MDIVTLDAVRAAPDRDTILRTQGIPSRHEVSARVEALAGRAADLYEELTDPLGLYAPITVSEFEEVFLGDGRNDAEAPLEGIFPRAEALALFVVTLGEAVSSRINDLFAANDPALGAMLDGIASERADAAAELMGEHFLGTLRRSEAPGPTARVLGYSPGYCGWHITAQRKLFASLEPERIGITLNSSCLMHPLKSVSGVLVVGSGEIHQFENVFDFCESCTTQECRARIASVS